MIGEKLEEWVKKDILKDIEDWDNRAKLMNRENFDSFDDYKSWSDGIHRCKKINIDCFYHIYESNGVPEDVIDKVIDECKEGGLP